MPTADGGRKRDKLFGFAANALSKAVGTDVSKAVGSDASGGESASSDSGVRRLVAFVGGLDLTSGSRCSPLQPL